MTKTWIDQKLDIAMMICGGRNKEKLAYDSCRLHSDVLLVAMLILVSAWVMPEFLSALNDKLNAE